MRPGLYLENIWFDSDVIELKVSVDDSESRFINRVYVSYRTLENLVDELNVFKTHIYGGIYDIELGNFGQEYANGAFLARLHFQDRGKIYISIRMQSEFYNFGKKHIANEAYLYVISEPVLLDNFINKLTSIHKEIGNIAILECTEKTR